MFVSPGAVALHTPFADIYWYGIIMAVAFLTGQFLIISIAKKQYNDKSTMEHIYDIAFYALLFGIIGAICLLIDNMLSDEHIVLGAWAVGCLGEALYMFGMQAILSCLNSIKSNVGQS